MNMKKLALGAVILAAISFASCKKDYDCKCTWHSGGLQGQETTITTSGAGGPGKVSKADAESWCTGQAYEGANYACELL